MRIRPILPLLILFFFASINAQTGGTKVKTDPAAFTEYAGRYVVDPGVMENFIFDITLENGQLWIKPSHIEKRKLVAQAHDNFTVDGVDFPLKFNRNEKGEVISFTIEAPISPTAKTITPHKILLPPPSVKGNTTFRLKGYLQARVVALAGTFNNWNQSQLLFAKEGDEWVCRIDLAPGKYTYKFIIDGNWITDPANPATEDDGTGNTNSVLMVEGK